jgi:hypothetical protein
MEPSELYEIATRFRRAVEARQASLRLFWMRDRFPTECCREASDMLGVFLADRYAVEATVVRGQLDGLSHAWLIIDGLIVDITADQFPDRFPNAKPFIVSSDSEMHAQFREQGRSHPMLLGSGDPENEYAEDARHDYRVIVKAFDSVSKPRS